MDADFGPVAVYLLRLTWKARIGFETAVFPVSLFWFCVFFPGFACSSLFIALITSKHKQMNKPNSVEKKARSLTVEMESYCLEWHKEREKMIYLDQNYFLSVFFFSIFPLSHISFHWPWVPVIYLRTNTRELGLLELIPRPFHSFQRASESSYIKECSELYGQVVFTRRVGFGVVGGKGKILSGSG